jgi:hypothetical protein
VSDVIKPLAARLPEEALELVSQALSDGDLEAALAQYESPALPPRTSGAIALTAALTLTVPAKSPSQTDAFLLLHDGRFITLAVPGATMTQAFGVNDRDEVVGAYTVGTGSSAVTHGFTWRPGYGFRTVDDPHGVGTTTVNGVNDSGDLVGFYVDSAGNTDGMLALPRH